MRKTTRLWGYLLGSLGLLTGAPLLHAGTIYSYAFEQSTYSLRPDTPTLIGLYLQETVTSVSISKLSTQKGLAVASVLLQETSSNSAVVITNLVAPVAFDGIVNTTPSVLPTISNAASIYETTVDPLLVPVNITQGVLASETTPGSGNWRVLIASYEFTAIGNPGTTTVFQAITPNNNSDFSTWDAIYGSNPTYSLLSNASGAAINGASLSITILPVPEPESLGILVAGLLALCRSKIK